MDRINCLSLSKNKETTLFSLKEYGKQEKMEIKWSNSPNDLVICLYLLAEFFHFKNLMNVDLIHVKFGTNNIT